MVETKHDNDGTKPQKMEIRTLISPRFQVGHASVVRVNHAKELGISHTSIGYWSTRYAESMNSTSMI